MAYSYGWKMQDFQISVGERQSEDVTCRDLLQDLEAYAPVVVGGVETRISICIWSRSRSYLISERFHDLSTPKMSRCAGVLLIRFRITFPTRISPPPVVVLTTALFLRRTFPPSNSCRSRVPRPETILFAPPGIPLTKPVVALPRYEGCK